MFFLKTLSFCRNVYFGKIFFFVYFFLQFNLGFGFYGAKGAEKNQMWGKGTSSPLKKEEELKGLNRAQKNNPSLNLYKKKDLNQEKKNPAHLVSQKKGKGPSLPSVNSASLNQSPPLKGKPINQISMNPVKGKNTKKVPLKALQIKKVKSANNPLDSNTSQLKEKNLESSTQIVIPRGKKTPSLSEKVQELNILNTSRGFVPSVIRVFKNSKYRFNVVNVRKENKNVSFVFSRYSIFRSTYFGEVTSFVLEPMHEGIYAFQCPETGEEGWMLVLPAKFEFIRSLSGLENLSTEQIQNLNLNSKGLSSKPSLSKGSLHSLKESVEDSFRESLSENLNQSAFKKKKKQENSNINTLRPKKKKKNSKPQSSLAPSSLKEELYLIKESLIQDRRSLKRPSGDSSFFIEESSILDSFFFVRKLKGKV